jgi:hypothetical protein
VRKPSRSLYTHTCPHQDYLVLSPHQALSSTFDSAAEPSQQRSGDTGMLTGACVWTLRARDLYREDGHSSKRKTISGQKQVGLLDFFSTTSSNVSHTFLRFDKALLRKLKEVEGLPWDEIAGRFPNRTRGAGTTRS